MKKKLLTFILAIVAMLGFNAFAESEAKLKPTSGDGTKLGDEVCLDDQCFYVLENDGKKATLLSKYNLHNGWDYNYVEIYDNEDFYEKTGLSEDESYIWSSYGDTDSSGKGYTAYFYFTYLDGKEIKQSSEAIGAHGGGKGEPEMPEIAIFNKLNSTISRDFVSNLENDNADDTYGYKKDGEKYSNVFQDFNFIKDIYYINNMHDGKEYSVLNGYEKYLDNQGLNINSINILSLTDLNNIVKNARGTELPLDSWVEDPRWVDGMDGHEGYYVYGNLKKELDSKYSWLWGTTYWLRTYDQEMNVVRGSSNSYGLLFVDTMGDVCSNGDCGIVGAGVRPVIVVDAKDIVKPMPIVNPETGGIAVVAILGIVALLIVTSKTKKRMN